MRAKLNRQPRPDGRPGTSYELDCRHGTTIFSSFADDEPDEAGIIRGLLLRHWQAERCWCAAYLWPQYGLALVREPAWRERVARQSG